MSIEGRKGGKVIYLEERFYNGAIGTVESTLVLVSGPPPRVESVNLLQTVIELYAEGPGEVLNIVILPTGVDLQLHFSIGDTTIATLRNGKVFGLKEGETWLKARSVEDTAKADMLQLVVRAKPLVPVDSVSVSPDTLRLYLGGESGSLKADMYPSSHQGRFAWSSEDPTVASVAGTGIVSPMSPGRIYVRALSLMDSTKGDSAIIIVEKDAPKIHVGSDTIISVGTILAIQPRIEQAYGRISEVRWDLDGDGAWEGQGGKFQTFTHVYDSAGVYKSRFYALDGEGNDTIVTKKITVAKGPAINFQEPKDGIYTNQNPIPVAWSVDGINHASQEILKSGPNVITKTAKNAAGDSFSLSITVHFDTVAPKKPEVEGPAGSSSKLRPKWTWASGGGGIGTFRFRLDNDNMSTGTTIVQDSVFTPSSDLSDGLHTLYVQERDSAGNWSPTGSFTVVLDATPPNPPRIDSSRSLSPLQSLRPTWRWVSGGGGGSGLFRVKLNNGEYSGFSNNTQFQPPTLSEGPHTLYGSIRVSQCYV